MATKRKKRSGGGRPRPFPPPKGFTPVALSPAQVEQLEQAKLEAKRAKAERRAKQKDKRLRLELVKVHRDLTKAKASAKRAERAAAKSKSKAKGGKRRLSKAERSAVASAAALRGWVTRRQNDFDRLVTRQKLSDAKKKWWSERKARQEDALKQRPGETRRQWIERIMSMPEINWERDYRWIAQQTGIGEREVFTVGVSPGSYGVEVA